MDLPIVPMLIGSLPVVIIITPCCISAGFMLKASEGDELKFQHKAIAEMTFVLSGVCAGGATMLATYFIQAKVSEKQQELDAGTDWMRDPQEAEVIEALAKDEEDAKTYARLTHWKKQPWWIQSTLVVGCLFATLMVFLLMNPMSE